MNTSNVIVSILVLAYFCWAMYSGWNWVSGRYEALEKQTIISKILKLIVVAVVGWVIGAVRLAIIACKIVIWLVSGGPFK